MRLKVDHMPMESFYSMRTFFHVNNIQWKYCLKKADYSVIELDDLDYNFSKLSHPEWFE